MLPTLYKKDSTGSIRVWAVQVEDDEVVVSHGLLGGAVVENRTRCVAKNVGRANATTPHQQAMAEAQAKWKKQIERERYTEDRSGEDNNAFLAPMLARDYTKVGHQLNWEEQVWGQCKYNGHRSLWDKSKQTLWSRKGTPITAPHEAIEQIQDLSARIGVNLDGELYNHGSPLNTISSAVKKRNSLTPNLIFVLFDVAEADMIYDERRLLLESLDLSEYSHIELAQTVPLAAPYAVKEWHDQFVREGYEGLILRENASKYAFGSRAKGLMKYKEFQDDEFLIVDVKPDVHGKQGILECITAEGKTFNCRCRGKDEYREWLLENKSLVIGKFATVRYFSITPYGLPEFPVGLVIGDEK